MCIILFICLTFIEIGVTSQYDVRCLPFRCTGTKGNYKLEVQTPTHWVECPSGQKVSPGSFGHVGTITCPNVEDICEIRENLPEDPGSPDSATVKNVSLVVTIGVISLILLLL